MIYSTDNYIEILKAEHERRSTSNPSYSLRAFARDLGISSSRLSLILNEKQGLSYKLAIQIALKLNLEAEEISYFCDLVESKHARSKLKKQQAQKRIKSKQLCHSADPLTFETMRIISEWYHFAILELTYVQDFKSDFKWIADQLGIKESVTKGAIERLIKVGLMENLEGRFSPTKDFTMSPDGISSDSIRKLHKQIMQKAISAIDVQSVDERDSSSIIFAFDTKNIPEIKKDIKLFRRNILDKYGQTENSNSVYNMSVQLINYRQSRG